MSTDDYAKVKAAADRGDRNAQRALDTLAQAAAGLGEPTRPAQAGGEKGIAEARRRYGPPRDAA